MRRRMLLQNTQSDAYLRVVPEGMRWITTTTDLDYNVYSNTDWIVT